MKENKIRRISETEHILKRTGRYVGSVRHIEQNMFLLEDSGLLKYTLVNYVPAFLKIVREIVDNSCDEYVRTGGKFANVIKINCQDDGTIVVLDNGRGIPVEKLDDDCYAPEAAWTELRAGANFDDEKDNITIGQNGGK